MSQNLSSAAVVNGALRVKSDKINNKSLNIHIQWAVNNSKYLLTNELNHKKTSLLGFQTSLLS